MYITISQLVEMGVLPQEIEAKISGGAWKTAESQCSRRASKTTPDPRMANAGAGSGQLQISGAAFPWPPA